MTLLRSLIYVLWLYGGMAVIGLVALPAAVFSREAGLVAIRVWARWAVSGARALCGIRLRFEGLEHLSKGPVLIASKHQAMLDTIAPFLVMSAPAIVLKRELLAMPIYGWFAKRSGMIPVDRDAHAKALKTMVREAKARMAEGRPIFIFPEGTRQAIGAPPAYKPGVAALYRELNVPCVPAALNTGLVWAARGLTRRPGEAVIRFLEPIPAGLPRREFMRLLEERIERESAALAGLPAPAAPAAAASA